MATVPLLVLFVLFHLVHLHSAQEPHNCPPSFSCAKLGNNVSLTFPFTIEQHPDCGLFSVSGCNGSVQLIQLGFGRRWYQIQNITSGSDTIFINDSTLQKNLESKSCEYFNDLALPTTAYASFHSIYNMSMFKCNRTLDNDNPSFKQLRNVSCDAFNYYIYYSHPDNDLLFSSPPPNCSLIQLPVTPEAHDDDDDDLFKMLSPTFSLQVLLNYDCVRCHDDGGMCEPDGQGNFHCPKHKGNNRSELKLGLGMTAAGIGTVMLLALAFLFVKRSVFSKKKAERYQNVDAFLQEFGSLSPKRYSYLDIKKITNLFKDKLGEGGFGGVYKGLLHDGRHVAVKVLKESKGNGEEFINEVASISRTSHINVVTLLGFCFEGHKRALVYEFMANGSLEKFVYEKNYVNADRQLKWETLYQIAAGIARGLEYLHRGCNTRILHFDIKPHNILLDEDFCPKISDFGLAKICPRKESIISMLGARGTAGYIAPEVFSRNFGRVSHKSDVYSYGMMVLEMVGGRRNIHCEADRTSEIYFPHWIYKRLELDELGLQGIVNKEDRERAKKMIIVSMWCIQTDPSNRPPMNRVVEMLEGSLESLQVPPKPFLSSPSRSPADSPIRTPADSPTITESLTL